jgi:hypothetical protein
MPPADERDPRVREAFGPVGWTEWIRLVREHHERRRGDIGQGNPRIALRVVGIAVADAEPGE